MKNIEITLLEINGRPMYALIYDYDGARAYFDYTPHGLGCLVKYATDLKYVQLFLIDINEGDRSAIVRALSDAGVPERHIRTLRGKKDDATEMD